MELHASIHEDDDGMYWAEVQELPGCFASGRNLDELQEALIEAIEMYREDESPAGQRPPTEPDKPRMRVDELKLVTA